LRRLLSGRRQSFRAGEKDARVAPHRDDLD